MSGSDTMSVSVVCDDCQAEQNEGLAVRMGLAESYCNQCQRHLCHTCGKNHLSHDLVEKNSPSENKNKNSNSSSFCQIHAGVELTMYCEDCQLTICGRCCAESHAHHRLCDVDTMANIFRQQILEHLKMVAAHAEYEDNRRRDLEEQRRSLEHFDDIGRSIARRGEELKALIDNDTNKLLGSLGDVRQRGNAGRRQSKQETESAETEGSDHHDDGFDDEASFGELTFTPSEIPTDGINIVGRLVVVETDGNRPETNSNPGPEGPPDIAGDENDPGNRKERS